MDYFKRRQQGTGIVRQAGTSCASLLASGLWGFFQFVRIFFEQQNVWGPRGLPQKLNLRHFWHECCKNLNIRTLRTKLWIQSGCEDKPQVVPAWSLQCFNNQKEDILCEYMVHNGVGAILSKMETSIIQTEIQTILKSLKHQQNPELLKNVFTRKTFLEVKKLYTSAASD